jgi:STE24 endopeptidase
MTEDEVLAVMAHELAHAKRKHVAKSMALFLFPALIAIDLLIFGDTLAQTNLLGVIPFVLGFALIFIGPQIALRFQRKFELDADEIAVRTLGDGKSMINALQKLAELNLMPGNKGSPTHPSITKRIQRIEQMTFV